MHRRLQRRCPLLTQSGHLVPLSPRSPTQSLSRASEINFDFRGLRRSRLHTVATGNIAYRAYRRQTGTEFGSDLCDRAAYYLAWPRAGFCRRTSSAIRSLSSATVMRRRQRLPEQAPGRPDIIPGHACDQCNLCSASVAPVLDPVLAGQLAPTRLMQVLQTEVHCAAQSPRNHSPSPPRPPAQRVMRSSPVGCPHQFCGLGKGETRCFML